MDQIMQHDFAGGGPVAGHYLAKSLGAPFKVYLSNGVDTTVDPVSGKTMTSITDLPGLIAAVVRSRVSHPRRLSGADLRFIRSALRLKSKGLAAALELTPEHYSRCETGQKAMSTTTEKLYRGYAFLISILNDKGVRDAVQQERKAKDIPPKDAQEALETVRKLFCDLKISPVFTVGEELSFSFSRRCPDKDMPCGDDDAKWENEVKPPLAA